MKITFKNEHIIAALRGTVAFEAIDELIGCAVLAGAIAPDAAKNVTLAVKQREQSMSTGVGFGVAIPHAAVDPIEEVIIAFGRSLAGIEFDSLDGQPVRFVALILVPVGEREKHLPTLARVSRLLHRKEIRAALETAADVEAIANILNEKSVVPA
jgi:mannitol/fructose-specific phosphotransferase system IIA component (Ntr-type)